MLLSASQMEVQVTNSVKGIYHAFDGNSSLSPNPRVAKNANDDSSNTFWTAADANAGHSLVIDLESNYPVNSTEVEWPTDGVAYRYKIETSTDSLSWTMVANRTSNNDKQQLLTDNFTAVEARYVRITITGGVSEANKASIAEFRVFDGSTTTIKSSTVLINCVKPVYPSPADNLSALPWFNLNENGWKQAAEITATLGSNIVLSTLSGASKSWEWAGPNGLKATASSLKLNNVLAKDSGEYVAISGKVEVRFNLSINNNTALKEVSGQSNIQIYPNPSKDGFFNLINCENKKLSVLSLDGGMLTAATITSNRHTLDLSRFEQGIYLIRLVSNNRTEYKKVIISE